MLRAWRVLREWGHFCVAAGSEYAQTGLLCLPPSWHAARRADPYGFYARLRDHSPVHRSSLAGGVVLSRAADISQALRDERITCEAAYSDQWHRNSSSQSVRALILEDGDGHRRHRKYLAGVLEIELREQLLETSAFYIHRYVTRLPSEGTMEVMEDFVLPMVRELTCEILGVEQALRPSLIAAMRHGLAFAFHQGEKLIRFPMVMWREAAQIEPFRAELRELFERIFSSTIENGHLGVIQSLARMVINEQLSRDEAFMLAEGVLSALFEPTAYSIGNSIRLLALRSDIYASLRQAPELASNAAREAMRLDSAVQAIFRFASADLQIGGKRIRRGENLVLLIGSANRDPRHFRNPDAFDLNRNERTNFTFGLGSHACLGAAASLAIVEEVLKQLVARYPRISIAGRESWRSSLPMRGLQSLPVQLGR